MAAELAACYKGAVIIFGVTCCYFQSWQAPSAKWTNIAVRVEPQSIIITLTISWNCNLKARKTTISSISTGFYYWGYRTSAYYFLYRRYQDNINRYY